MLNSLQYALQHYIVNGCPRLFKIPILLYRGLCISILMCLLLSYSVFYNIFREIVYDSLQQQRECHYRDNTFIDADYPAFGAYEFDHSACMTQAL